MGTAAEAQSTVYLHHDDPMSNVTTLSLSTLPRKPAQALRPASGLSNSAFLLHNTTNQSPGITSPAETKQQQKGHSSDPTYNSQPSLKHSGVYRTRDAWCVTNLHPGGRAPRGGEELQVRPPLQGTKEHRNLRSNRNRDKENRSKKKVHE